jgi:hypothetical protein
MKLTNRQLCNKSQPLLALFFYNIALGVDERPICIDRESKSIGTETTYSQNLLQSDEIYRLPVFLV